MPVRPIWTDGASYTENTPPLWHEGVLLQCLLAHTAIAGPSGNEPDVAPDPVWQTFWAPLTPFWSDWMYARLPMWFREVDNLNGLPLYRFLRILGRAINQNEDDGITLEGIKDADQTPDAYLDAYAANLGIVLPHSFDTLDPDAARRLLTAIVALYKRKGCLPSIEWIATRYMGITISIFTESVLGHYYGVSYDDSTVPVQNQVAVETELTSILNLYGPAGLTPLLFPESQGFPFGDCAGGDNSTASPYSTGKGDVSGNTDTSGQYFQLDVIISS